MHTHTRTRAILSTPTTLIHAPTASQVIRSQQDRAMKSAKEREELLMREKQRQDQLIEQIFPKKVAKELIRDNASVSDLIQEES